MNTILTDDSLQGSTMMFRNKLCVLGIGLFCLLLAACDQVENFLPGPVSGDDHTTEPLRFAVIGDVPYNVDQEFNLRLGVEPPLDQANFPFIVHVGDWKGQNDCTAEKDTLFKQWISDRTSPVFYTPGDNEWTDCDVGPRFIEVPVSELGRLETIRNEYFSEIVDAPELAVERQAEQVENQSWSITHSGSTIVFGTLHVVGTTNGRANVFLDDPDEAVALVNLRDSLNLEWLGKIFERAREENAAVVVIAQQADPTTFQRFSTPCTTETENFECDPYLNLNNRLAEEAAAFNGPVLLIHGDTFPYCSEENFLNTPDLWRFNITGDHALTDAAIVSIWPDSTIPFAMKSLRFNLEPAPCQN